MLGGFCYGDHALYVRMHLEEVRTRAEEDRRARQARGSRSLRRCLGHMLIAAGTALLGPPTEREGCPPGGPSADAHPVLSVAVGWSVLTAWHGHREHAVSRGGKRCRHGDPTRSMGTLPREMREWIRLVRCPAVMRSDVPREAASFSGVSLCPWAEHHGEEAATRLVLDTTGNRWRCLDTGEGGPAFAVTWRREELPRTEVLALCLEHRPGAPFRTRRGV